MNSDEIDENKEEILVLNTDNPIEASNETDVSLDNIIGVLQDLPKEKFSDIRNIRYCLIFCSLVEPV